MALHQDLWRRWAVTPFGVNVDTQPPLSAVEVVCGALGILSPVLGVVLVSLVI